VVTDAEGAGYVAPAGVSAKLRAAREAAGLTLEQLTSATRISSRHLAAIEADNWASLPPGRPYAIGFARSYAKAVGLDERAIADEVRKELDSTGPVPSARVISQFEPTDPAKTPTRGLLWLSLLAGAMLVLGGLAFWRNYYQPSAGLPALAGPAVPAPTPVAAHPAGPAAPAMSAGTGAVVFTALEDKIWAKFYDGSGKQLLQKQLAKGESYTIPADAQNPQIWTGRPDALAITVGGKPVAKLADQQRTMKDVPISAAALAGRPPPVIAPSSTASPTALASPHA
jgi:transcriptional regulator with XRE-family HTH domain